MGVITSLMLNCGPSILQLRLTCSENHTSKTIAQLPNSSYPHHPIVYMGNSHCFQPGHGHLQLWQKLHVKNLQVLENDRCPCDGGRCRPGAGRRIWCCGCSPKAASQMLSGRRQFRIQSWGTRFTNSDLTLYSGRRSNTESFSNSRSSDLRVVR